MKYKLCDWEDNGYHDSYFYGVYFDTDDGQLHSEQTGATAYAGGTGFDQLPTPTPEVCERARLLLAAHIFEVIKAAEHRDVMTPQNVEIGKTVLLLVQHASRKTGQVLQPGTCVRVNSCEAFGTFYRNGYNKPNRENRSIVGTILGRPEILVRVPLKKCRLNREPMSNAELRERADSLSEHHNYGAMFGCKAWLSNNWALDVATKARDQLLAA